MYEYIERERERTCIRPSSFVPKSRHKQGIAHPHVWVSASIFLVFANIFRVLVNGFGMFANIFRVLVKDYI